ncbi:MAG: UDP-glucose 4-epimerase GalE [Gammaproteobacteria bacterium]|nr:UDP-glucose 4-epimerase GalE [Gammaproteobacteria bacterium]
MKNILIVGGAGYIGTHKVVCLLEQGYHPIVLDNVTTGHQKNILGGQFIAGDCGNKTLLDKIFTEHAIDAVMHFAAYSQVGESVQAPQKYYQNNVANTLTLLDAMLAHHVKHFIFSSTAAIFGEPQYIPINEQHPKNPLNPYGRSKWMVEQVLQDYDAAYGLKSVCLRYFNAAGADPQGRIGECHEPESHLIPLVLQTAAGKREQITIFGDDYATADGTCIRDYIHVTDLCDAHWLALQQLLLTKHSAVYNLGNGDGFSVKEVIASAKQVTGRNFNVAIAPRRPGDPARLIADARQAQQALSWQPRYADLASIIAHAWQWEMTCL